MSSLDLVADEAKHQSAAARNENASLSPRVALRKDLSAVVASMSMMKRSLSSNSLLSTGVKACVCAPTKHPAPSGAVFIATLHFVLPTPTMILSLRHRRPQFSKEHQRAPNLEGSNLKLIIMIEIHGKSI
jgi:hypothetical protein